MRIAALGDSITYGYGVCRKDVWTALLQEKMGHEVMNFGISGDTTAGMLARFNAHVLPEKPQVLILIGGSNDLLMGLDPVHASANLKTIIYEALHARMHIYVGLPFTPSLEVDAFGDFSKDLLPAFLEKRRQLEENLQAFGQTGHFTFFNLEHAIQGNPSLYLDSLHLNGEGNRVMADYIYRQLRGE